MINRQIIIYFTVKKVQEIKKNGYAATTKVLFIFTFFIFIGGNYPLSCYIVFYIHFPTTSQIMEIWNLHRKIRQLKE